MQEVLKGLRLIIRIEIEQGRKGIPPFGIEKHRKIIKTYSVKTVQ